MSAARPGLDGLLDDVRGPVFVVSSKAGLGNYTAGAELARRIGAAHRVTHLPVEALASPDRVRSDFDRHRWICLHAPWLLHFIQGNPVSYRAKLLREVRRDDPETRAFGKRVRSFGARTIIATNSRAALWLACLKRQGRLDAALWAFLTDYALSTSWRFQPWSEIDRAFGPMPAYSLPQEVRDRYRQVEMPVGEGFRAIAATRGAPDEVLLCGGAWGLGRLSEVSTGLARHLPGVRQHVVCGDNGSLLVTMRSLQRRYPSILPYPQVPDLSTILARCGSVITKPGGLTLAEAHAAGRVIFLIDGLPGTEEKNSDYALVHLDARRYSLASFGAWLSERRAPSAPREG